jgi:hypothetical protein
MRWWVVVLCAVVPFLAYGLLVACLRLSTWAAHTRVLRAAEAAAGIPRPGVGRIVVAGVVVWSAMSLLITTISTALAVWAGGLVVAGTAAVVAARLGRPMDEAAFDDALRALLDEAA